jgi:hypothetical protein
MPLINMGTGKCFEPTAQQGGPSNSNGLPIQQRNCSPGVIQPTGTRAAGPAMRRGAVSSSRLREDAGIAQASVIERPLRETWGVRFASVVV